MKNKFLVYLIIGMVVLTVNKIAIAKEETVDAIYHFVFKLQNNISISENEAIFRSFQVKMDDLSIEKCNISRDRDMFIVTAKTHLTPEDIVTKIQSDKFPVLVTFLAYFICDVAEHYAHYFPDASLSVSKTKEQK